MAFHSSVYYDSNKNKNCITGDSDHLYERLKKAIICAKKIDIIVAFLMESGVRLLVEDLGDAIKNGATLRILCGNYLNITQPQALYLLKDSLGDNIDLRFYNVPNKSFHPKAYIFEYDDRGEIFVGSSNISHSALTNGIEWNYRISSEAAFADYCFFKNTFEDLFLNHSTVVDDNEMRMYSKAWKRPKLFEDLEKLEGSLGEIGLDNKVKTAEINKKFFIDSIHNEECKVIQYPCPIGPQIEALYELKKCRQEGWDKGIVIAATGVGKTFLAAFDSKSFDKVLFVAHREEILKQAETTFLSVRPKAKTGFFSGLKKDKDCDILFATIQTIGRREYLNEIYFGFDQFDYIVIDEFHHVVSKNYINIMEYFKPKFLLGLTATPERLDSKDIFALCDYNIVYEARLKEAINKGWLIPFRYYGIYDETDYSSIDYKNGKYDEVKLEQALNINKRADLILQNYLKYNSKRALGFCSSRAHAIFMTKYFMSHGIKASVVISGNISLSEKDTLEIQDRKKTVERFRRAEINVIFSVDIFNEGLDVPEVDMVMFLRPTESPTVFLQQLGRGLRKKGEKRYVNVLDFIGNYKKANLIPFLLSGEIKDIKEKTIKAFLPDEDEYPDGCIINFDLKLIDIFKKMANDQKEVFERVREEYYRIKEDSLSIPLRLNMYTFMDEGIYNTITTKKDMNIFKDYISFLDRIGELSEDERQIIGTIAHKFIIDIENMAMSKLYKIPILLAFYNNGDIRLCIDEENIYESFRLFYSYASNSIDLIKDKSTKNFRNWGKKEYIKLARKNPMYFLMQSSSNFFYEENNRFYINKELNKYIGNRAFIAHFKDVIDYRTRKFYKDRLEKLKEKNINEV